MSRYGSALFLVYDYATENINPVIEISTSIFKNLNALAGGGAILLIEDSN